jgi:hypothetical protein
MVVDGHPPTDFTEQALISRYRAALHAKTSRHQPPFPRYTVSPEKGSERDHRVIETRNDCACADLCTWRLDPFWAPEATTEAYQLNWWCARLFFGSALPVWHRRSEFQTPHCIGLIVLRYRQLNHSEQHHHTSGLWTRCNIHRQTVIAGVLPTSSDGSPWADPTSPLGITQDISHGRITLPLNSCHINLPYKRLATICLLISGTSHRPCIRG